MSPDVVIRSLGKKYRIGESLPYRSLRETLAKTFNPLSRRRRGASDDDRHIWALREVSFAVEEGETLGIIGRNGAGKSTLLKILSRITDPTEGEITIRGRVGSLLEVGTGFHPELTGRENIYLNGAILGMRKREIRSKFDSIVDFAEIETFLDTPVKRYSSGMYVRLAFSVTAHLEPDILLVDEVLAVGDASFQKKCLGTLQNVSRKSRTVIFVSHNMAMIANLCSRVIWLNSGRVERDGETAPVISEYVSTIQEAGGEVRWDDPETAPGDNTVRLRAVRILQEKGGQPMAEVDISREVLVQIVYEVRRDGEPVYTAVHLKDKMGTYVLASSNNRSVSLTEDRWNGRPHPRGFYHSSCRLPGDFLNDGLYSITAIVGRVPGKTLVREEDVLSFTVIDTGDMRKSTGYGTWIGVVRPRLAWDTEKMKR